MSRGLDHEIAAVVEAGNCSGCGACCLLDDGLTMELNENGYLRPRRMGPPRSTGLDAPFGRICPGVSVTAHRPEGAARHDVLGSTFGSWQAWATNAELRFRGSSGGALSALVEWLLRTGQAEEVVEATRAQEEPRRTVTVTLRTPSQIVGAAGSRYAPVGNAAQAVLGRPGAVFVGKPCEVAAVRSLALATGQDAPLLLSFFCAGTPSQAATDTLVEQLADGQPVTDLWYRGHGWPGSFTVTRADGTLGEDGYDHSWGRVLGPTVQWRCKICPDGVGEAADIVAADYWQSDDNGYPVFDERDGVSAVIARTERGLEVLNRAFAEGVLAGERLDLNSLAAVQPSQVERRRTLLARLLGTRLAGRPVPRVRGLGLVRMTRGRPRALARIVAGSYRRVKAGRAHG